MDHQNLHKFMASVPGGFGQQLARQIAVNQVLVGNADYAPALVDLVGLRVLPALVAARVSPAVLRAAIGYPVISHFHALRSIDRVAFVAWSRHAQFSVPPGTPETVTLFRGTMGISPAIAASGLHWSVSFDAAAAYACRFVDDAGTGLIVLHAHVPRNGIAAFIEGTAHQEVIPAEAPTMFEVVTDKRRIADAAAREVARCKALMAQGLMFDIDTVETHRIAEQGAMTARAQMAAAGVVPGTAIVA